MGEGSGGLFFFLRSGREGEKYRELEKEGEKEGGNWREKRKGSRKKSNLGVGVERGKDRG